jgi:dipeptidyl aminopeptidase/acylaminoacyl peptidase
MNFRGSLGYGAGFAGAGARQWGGVIHNDITDGARWLVEQKIADPERLCIVGSSFGGYAALLGAARESEWYACAASFAGTSDLMAFYQFTQRLPDAPMWRERLGDDARALWRMSPLALAWRIETPVLLMHGRRDAVVPISQSRRLARELRKAGKQHELIERSDCDHHMTADGCRVAMFTALDGFLSRSLRPE